MDSSIRVLSTLALEGAVGRLAGTDQAEGGARIDADFAPTLALLDRIRCGEGADVVILTRQGLDELLREGRVLADSCVDLARSYVGLAVKADAARPHISTEAALRAALLGTRAVAYSQLGASAILFAQLIERLGIAGFAGGGADAEGVRGGALNLPPLGRNLPAMRMPRNLFVLVAAVALAGPALAHAQSADLVLCDRVAACPADPDKPADVKGVPDVAPADIATAIKFCKISAGTSRRAMYQLGRAYAAKGQLPEAIGAWRKAADKGSSTAMVELGVLY